MQILIVDASVAIKWFPPFDSEPLAAAARALLDRWSRAEIQIAVPDLFWAEIGNILWKSVRVGRCSRSEADELLRTMQMMNLPAIPSAQLVELALSIASFDGRAIYDCLNVALSKQSGAEMVSADEKLLNSLAGHSRKSSGSVRSLDRLAQISSSVRQEVSWSHNPACVVGEF